jgi:hypothetical protein
MDSIISEKRCQGHKETSTNKKKTKENFDVEGYL